MNLDSDFGIDGSCRRPRGTSPGYYELEPEETVAAGVAVAGREELRRLLDAAIARIDAKIAARRVQSKGEK